MQGRARGRKGERKTYHTWQNPHKGETQGVLSYQNYKGTFANLHMKKCWYSLGQLPECDTWDLYPGWWAMLMLVHLHGSTPWKLNSSALTQKEGGPRTIGFSGANWEYLKHHCKSQESITIVDHLWTKQLKNIPINNSNISMLNIFQPIFILHFSGVRLISGTI